LKYIIVIFEKNFYNLHFYFSRIKMNSSRKDYQNVLQQLHHTGDSYIKFRNDVKNFNPMNHVLSRPLLSILHKYSAPKFLKSMENVTTYEFLDLEDKHDYRVVYAVRTKKGLFLVIYLFKKFFD